MLKGWLSVSRIKYERIHDLQVLFSLFKEQSENIPLEFEELEYPTDFAVTFRYELYEDNDAALDRESVLNKIRKLMDLVRSVISSNQNW